MTTPADASLDPRVLTAETPGDLLAVMPYLLGYHPTESIVLVLLEGRTVDLCARMDLDPGGVPAATVAAVTADRLAGIVHAHESNSVVLVGYSADRARAAMFLDAALDRLAEVAVLDALHADGWRWWSRLCDDAWSGAGIVYSPDSSRIAAEAVYAGMTAASSRHELVQRVSGPPAGDTDALGVVAAAMADEVFASSRLLRQRWIKSLVSDFVRRRRAGESPQLADSDRLRLACLAADVLVRDGAWAMMRRATAPAHVELWQQVVERTVAPFEAAPLCLLGMAAWISGQGTMQVCCIDRVQTVDPDYSMGDLLAEINRRAMPPQLWDDMQPSIAEAMDAHPDAAAESGDARH